MSYGWALACIWLVLGVVAANASAAPGWLEPEDISAANEVVDGRPQVAVDPAGNAVAIWERHVGGEEIVESSERPATGDWSEPEVLSLPGEEGQQSRVEIDASGTAIAVWITEESSTGFVVRSAVRPPGGEWSEPEDVSDSTSETVLPMLAVDAAGEAVAVWTDFDGSNFILQGAVRSANGEWSEPDDLSEAGGNVTPLEAPDVAIDASGNAIAVWKLEGDDDVVQAAVRPAGGDWAEPDDLSDTGQDAREPSVAIDEAGEAVAVWSRFNGSNYIVQAAVRLAGDEWSDPDDLSASGQTSSSPVVATNVAVGAVAMWWRFDGANFRVQATVRPPGGEWPKPDTLSAAGEGAAFPNLALDAAGDAIAVFGRNGDDGPFVQATGYDFAAPRLNAVQIPATGTVGEPVSFGVSPFDVFPFTTSWTFGDGGPGASGNTVSHVYTAPGAYPVTVSAVDGGGNTSTQIGAIGIVAPPKPPPPPPPPVKIALSLKLGTATLDRLLRSGKLVVLATVNKPAQVTLSGKAKLHLPGRRGGPQVKLVNLFTKKAAVQLATAGERKVKLKLSKRGRSVLSDLTSVRILVAGEATGAAGEAASNTLAQTLQR